MGLVAEPGAQCALGVTLRVQDNQLGATEGGGEACYGDLTLTGGEENFDDAVHRRGDYNALSEVGMPDAFAGPEDPGGAGWVCAGRRWVHP